MTSGWTGRTACALQAALRLSNELFAQRLGIGARTVTYWHMKGSARPRSEMQQLLDTALEQATPAERARFEQLAAEPAAAPGPAVTTSNVDARLHDDPNVAAALDWLDQHAAWQPGTARQAVAARLADLDVGELRDRGTRRGAVGQPDVARALAAYYSTTATHGRYAARIGTQAVETSVLTCADWLDLACPLASDSDRLTVNTAQPDVSLRLDADAAHLAVERLAETLALDIRLTDSPLYRLLNADIRRGHVGGMAGIARFAQYALTVDLLEGELVDALASDQPTRPGGLPLRDRYLPDLAAVLDLDQRLCAGGVLALCAIARPVDLFRGGPDFLLLIQERSGHVLNAARRLAVIPKGFHQPLTDVRADAQVGATLRREMEEELFGRPDLDNTRGDQLSADPMHPTRLSEPMRWLTEHPGRLRTECTGFGLNLVSGNYEFASLIVIEDEEFWARHGGAVEANWESSTLRRYSTLDADLVTELIADVAWSNEGLFAMLQGLRRLAEIDEQRVVLPPMEWEIRQ